MSQNLFAPVPEQWCHSKTCLAMSSRKPELPAIGDSPGGEPAWLQVMENLSGHRQKPAPTRACTVLHGTSMLGPKACAKVWTRQYVSLPVETTSQNTPPLHYKRWYNVAACTIQGLLDHWVASRVYLSETQGVVTLGVTDELTSWDAPLLLLKLTGFMVVNFLLWICPDWLLSFLLPAFFLLVLSLYSS